MSHETNIPEIPESIIACPVNFLILLLLFLGGFATLFSEELVEPGIVPQPGKDGFPLELLFAGDIMVHDKNFEHEPFSLMYDGVRDILHSADLSFGNLEFPVNPDKPYAGYPLFNAHPAYVQAAIDAGFNVFSLANNHSADGVAKGFESTDAEMHRIQKSNLEAGNPLWFNGLRTKDGTGVLTPPLYRMEIIECKGWRTGFVSVTGFLNLPYWRDSVQLMDWQDPKRLQIFVDWIKEQRSQVDLLVIGIHWGVEYETRTLKSQKDAAKALVDAGADIIWGHHPHVLQPWYLLDSPRGQALVLPSLGNFVSAQAWYLNPGLSRDPRAYKGDSSLFRLSVSQDESRRLIFNNREPILIAHRRMEKDNIQVFPYRDLLKLSDETWAPFFRTRFEILSGFFPESRDASLLFDGMEDTRTRTLPETIW